MFHSQLRLKLPNHPYIWDNKNIRQTYDVNGVIMSYEEVLSDIYKIYNDSEKVGLKPNFIIDDILCLIENNNNIEIEKKYMYVSQKLPKNTSITAINFHTTAYYNEIGGLIDREYKTNISWLVIPIIGYVGAQPIETKIIKNPIDNNIKYISQLSRAEARAYILYQEQRVNTLRHNREQTNREQSNKEKKNITPSESQNVTVADNEYEYIYDDVGIKQDNYMLIFDPITSGKIYIQHNNKNIIYFISFMTHKTKNYITLHEIIFT